MSLESPLGKVRGLGSAKEGVGHWWWQRLTAIALVPLTLWFVWSAICLAGADYGAAREFFASPWRATLMIIFLGALLFHGQLGLQTVIEDYVHSGGTRMFLLIAIKFAAVILGVASVLAVLKLTIGAGFTA